ncbi:MAG: T9SS type A sorting domain-containing protein [Bacteroidota bacterium]
MKKILPLGLFMLFSIMIHAQCPGFLGTGFETIGAIPFSDTGHDTATDVDDMDSGNMANVCDANYLTGNDYVYIFTPGTTQDYVISLTNQSSIWGGFHVYDGCPDTGNCIADGTSSSATDAVTTTLTSGTTYYIVVDIYATPVSYVYDFSIELPAAPPANDECSGAIALTVNPDLACGTTTPGTVEAATGSGVDDSACGGTEDDDVWFSFVATATTHNIDLINIANGTTDLYHSLWEGSCGALTLVPGTCSDPNNSIPTGLTIGATYYLRVYTWIATGGQTSTFDVCIGTPPAPPANDECSTATSIVCDDNLIGETTESSTDNGDDTGCFVGAGVWYEFIGIDGSVTVTVSPEVGYDPELAIASSSDCISFNNVGCADAGGGGGAETITFTSVSGTTYYFFVGHYTSATTFGDFDIAVTCTACVEPTFSLSNGTNNCPTGTEYNIDVDITDLGSAMTTVDITYDDGNGPQTVMGVGLGSTSIGPFAPGTNVDVTVADSNDSNCSSSSSISTPSVCPPSNDECSGAISLTVNPDFACGTVTNGTIANATGSGVDDTACSGTEDDDVWFSFVATATEHTIDLLNITGGTTDLYHSVWEGSCGSLSLLAGSCSDPNSSTATGLTIGLTYYLRVYSWTSTSGQTSVFDVCIGTAPPPPPEDVCTGALVIPVTSDMCTGVTTGNNSGATDSDNDVPAPPAATCTAYSGGDIWFKLTVPASGFVTISGANSDGCCSYLWYEMYTGADCSALTSIGCSDTNSGTDNNDPSTYETALTGLTPGEMVWIRAWDSSNDNGPGDFNLCAYEPTCAAPTVTIPADPIDNTNCPATVDVTISIDDLGDSGTLTISGEDDMGNPAGTGGMTSSIGTFTITNIPVPQTSWSIIIEHESNATCNVVLGPFLLNCPPLNDNACDAEALTVNDPPAVGNNAYSTVETSEPSGGCWFTSVDESVWFSFIAPGSGLVEITTDFVTPLDDTQLALYELTDCSDLSTANPIGCAEDNGITGSGFMSIINTSGAPLTGGNMYYVQVDGYDNLIGEFNIQVNELAPVNDDCATASLLAMNTTGSLINQYFQNAQPSGMGPEACDVAGTPNPGDIWYEIDTDADGGTLIVIVEPGPNSDVVVSIYDACGSPIPEQCVDLGGNGGVETINFVANIKDDKGGSSTRDADYFVRVYEKIPSGQPFEIGAQGAALPIELGSFEAIAEPRGNKVFWSTLSEINSDFIEVQSSPNGSTNWESIGRVEARGESTTKVDYEFFDFNPYEVTYYRLNAVDKDGTSELSNVINVKRTVVVGTLTLTPNPAREFLTVQSTSATEGQGTYSIVDMSGKLMQKITLTQKRGLNTHTILTDELKAGLYLLLLQTDDGLKVEKFVKQ